MTKAIDPENAEHKYFRRNKFDVNCIKWCPHAENKQQLAAAVNLWRKEKASQHFWRFSFKSSQFFELYNLRSSGIQILGTSRAHSRNITDLDWDRFCSYQFATCSVDDSVNVWDVRDLKKPSLSLSIVGNLTEFYLNTYQAGSVKMQKLIQGR